MQKYSEYIEKVFQNFFIDSTHSSKSSPQHIFLHDMHRVDIEPNSPQTLKPNLNIQLPDSVPKSKCSIDCLTPLTKKEIEELYKYYQVPNPKQNLSHKLKPYINKCLKSDPFPKEATILIIGGGPAGIYTALYAKKLLPTISILIIDNYIVSEGLRKPFSRSRSYSIQESDLAYMNPYVPCWKEFGYSIKYMELFFYIHAKYYNIKFAFTKKYETWDKIKALSQKLKTNLIIDATGGRLNIPKPKYIPTLQSFLPNNVKLENKKYKVYQSSDNTISLKWKTKTFPQNNLFLAIDLFQNNLPLASGLITDLKTQEDYDFWKKLDKHCIYLSDLLKLNDPYINDILAWFKKYFKKKNVYAKFKIFDANLHHSLSISQVIFPTLIYVGIGDTIFHSHFYTGAGLSRTLFLVRKIIDPLPYILNQLTKDYHSKPK